MTTTQSISKYLRSLGIAAAIAAMALALAGLQSEFASAGAMTPAKGVSIKGFAFHAATTHVKKGATVTFSNKDGVTHTATGRAFNTGRIASGKSKSITLKQKGTFAFHCMIHPEMHGKIVVE
jgi:plastocyanin